MDDALETRGIFQVLIRKMLGARYGPVGPLFLWF